MDNGGRRVYITRDLPEIAVKILREHFEVVDVNFKGPLSPEQLREKTNEYDAILSTTLDFFTQEILENSQKLKAIANFAVGLDNIDLKAAELAGIKVFNLPDIVTNSTADLAMALLLSYERQICQANEFVKSGHWDQWDPRNFVGHEMCSKTIGILGFGRIGQAVAKRALGFGMKVQYSCRTPKKLAAPLADSCMRVDLDQLYQESDYLCLLVPLTETTKGMIDKDVFQKMKKEALLLNMARGQVVNTEDLVEVLQKKIIRGAMLDVTDPEPLPIDHPLLKMKNCMIIPHIGTSTVECRNTMAKRAAELLVEHL